MTSEAWHRYQMLEKTVLRILSTSPVQKLSFISNLICSASYRTFPICDVMMTHMSHTDKKKGHQRSFLKLRFKMAENWPVGSLKLALKDIKNLPIESGPTGSYR